MKRREPRGDSRVADALRRAEAGGAEWAVGPLARRIVIAASPLLEARRPSPAAWWEYAAQWGRMLIPLGVTVGLAAGFGMLWVTTARPMVAPPAPESQALLGVMTNEVSAPQLVDFALSTSRWRGSVVAPAGPNIPR